MSQAYRDAGVDINAGYKSVELIKKHIKKTAIPGVLSGIGGFGGLFMPDITGYRQPVLVSGTDGVGTKLKLAFILDKHGTIGCDAVAMCVNDVICCGAKPLFFLDYLAVGKNHPAKIASIVGGVADGCVQAGCALIGGETAEMPGFYPEDEYDLAGFCVGIVDKEKMLSGANVRAGDAIVGIVSSGVHSNGFSLIRKLFKINSSASREILGEYIDSIGCTLGEELIKPTKIYVHAFLPLLDKFEIKAAAHITGGGFIENIPRMLRGGLTASITRGSFPVPHIFSLISEHGNIGENDMYNTFNMGIGFVFAVARKEADAAIAELRRAGEKAYKIGEVVSGKEGIIFK